MQVSASTQKPTSRLSRLWNWLTLPFIPIASLSERKYAQLVASVAIVILLLLPGNFLATRRLPDLSQPQGATLALLIFIIAISYLMARGSLHRLAAWLIIGSMNALGFVHLGSTPGLPLEDIIVVLVIFTPIALALTATLLKPGGIFFISLLNFIAIILLPAMQPAISQRMASATGGGILTLGILLTVLIGYRNNTESENVEQLQSANEELSRIQVTLEERVEERTAELNRRSAQLETAAQVARSAAEVRDLKSLLENVVNQITERFGFYHAGLFLTEGNSPYVVLQAASSEGGKKMLARGHRLEIGRQGIVGYAAYQKRPRIAQNVGADSAYFNNPDLPLTRSEIALPLEVQNNLIGVLDIQSEREHAFANEDVYSLQAMADQIALAIENTRLIEESRDIVAQMEKINTENAAAAWRDRLASGVRGFLYTPTGISALRPNQAISQETPAPTDDFTLRVPITLRGQEIGSIVLRRKSGAKPWGKTEQEVADKIAAQAALAVENARLLEETQRRALREQTLNELSARFSRSLDVEALLQNAARELQRLPQVSSVSVVVSPGDPGAPVSHKA